MRGMRGKEETEESELCSDICTRFMIQAPDGPAVFTIYKESVTIGVLKLEFNLEASSTHSIPED